MANGPNPFDEIERMFERMSRQFDRAAEDLEGGLEPLVGGSVRVDLEDRGDAFVLTADLPGFDSEDIDLRLSDGVLHVEATRETGSGSEAGSYLRRERQRHSVSRSVPLTDPVEEDAIDAEHSNGVLTVTLPKRDTAGGTSIDIT